MISLRVGKFVFWFSDFIFHSDEDTCNYDHTSYDLKTGDDFSVEEGQNYTYDRTGV